MKRIATFLLIFLCGIALYGQSPKKVSGVVKDDAGNPLPGATVTVKGQSKKVYALTDLDGRYTISIPGLTEDTELEFSYLGMKPSEIKVGKRSVVDVVMSTDGNVLDEVVIVAGYGLAQKRSDMTGSAFQVDSKKLEKLPAARIDNLLDGMVPGLTIEEKDGSTGGRSQYRIRVRGDASLSASSEPLWIIDGVPVYTGTRTSSTLSGMSYSVSPLSFINPDDIESMTVLKDAATTALYGADGANGVILVTTKSGDGDSKLRVNASVRYGVSQVDRSTLLRLCSTEQWWALAEEAWTNAGYSMDNFPYQDNEHNSYSTTSTDWYDVYFGTGSNAQHNVSVSSGGSKAKHYLSLSYYNEKTVVKGNQQQRFSARDRSSYKFSKKLSADLNMAVSYNVNDILSVSRQELRVIPIFSPYDEDGVTPRMYNYFSKDVNSYAPQMYKFVYSSVPDRKFNDNQQRTLAVDGDISLKYEIIEGLTATAQAGANILSGLELLYYSKHTTSGLTDLDQDGRSQRSAAYAFTWNNIDRLNFNRRFGKHSVGALAGIEFVNKENRNLYAQGNGFANDNLKEIKFAQTGTLTGYSGASNSRSLSYMLQGTYSFDNRYYLSLSWRRQGYSSFSTYSRWGDFSSVGLSWNAHNEKWYHIPWMDKLKIKSSFGNSGNSRVDTSAAYGSYSYNSGDYYGGIMGATQSSAPNPGLSWENTYIFNVGINLGFLNGRIDLEIEAYDKYTTGLLYSGRVSSIITDAAVTRNVGAIENQGLEFTLSTKNIDNPKFKWSTDINGSVNRNVIRELYKDMHTGFFDSVWMVGASKSDWWLSRWAGVDPATGSPMWYTVDGDLTFNFSYDNRVLLPEYSKEPDLSGGVSNTFSFGPFSARVMMTYSIGGWTLTSYTQDDGHDIIGFNTVVEDLDHWRKPGDVSKNPKYVYKSSNMSTMSSTRFLYNKTNVQLKNITLSYTFPKSFCRKAHLSGATFSLMGDNLYLWTPGQSKSHNSYKTLIYTMGMTRSVSGQLSLNF